MRRWTKFGVMKIVACHFEYHLPVGDVLSIPVERRATSTLCPWTSFELGNSANHRFFFCGVWKSIIIATATLEKTQRVCVGASNRNESYEICAKFIERKSESTFFALTEFLARNSFAGLRNRSTLWHSNSMTYRIMHAVSLIVLTSIWHKFNFHTANIAFA